MRSDWEDTPDYLHRKKPRPWRLFVFMGLSVAVIWGAIELTAKPIVINLDLIKQAILVDGKPLFAPQSPQPYNEPETPSLPPQVAQSTAPQQIEYEAASQPEPELEWSEQHMNTAMASAQNAFNDSNYTPKQPASTYSPPAAHQVAPATTTQTQRSAPRTRQVQRELTQRWIKSWNGGTNYFAEWLSINNYIDDTSVCSNHRRGSIEFRECRKAAKRHFHEQCQTWRARYSEDRKNHSDFMKTRYCTASSSFNPMG